MGDMNETSPSVDWTSPDPAVERLECEDEVAGLDVSKDYIVVQYWIQPDLAVFCRRGGRLLRLLVGHEYGGQCVVVKDNEIVYSASLDRTLRSWDVKTGAQLCMVCHHADYVQCLAVEGAWVATGGQGDKRVVVYTTAGRGDLTMKHTLTGHTGWVRRLRMKGDKLVSASLDMTVRVWDMCRGSQLRCLTVDAPVVSLELAGPDHALYGDKEGRVSFLQLDTGSCSHLMPCLRTGMDRFKRSVRFHEGSVDALVFLPDQGLAVTGSDDRFIRLWHLENWTENVRLTEVSEIDTIREHSEYINNVLIRDNFIFSSSGDVNVLIHQYPFKGQVRHIEEYEVATLSTSPPRSSPRPPPVLKALSPLPPVPEGSAVVAEAKVEVEEEEEQEQSSTSESNSEKPRRRRRKRWLISRDEVTLGEELGRGRYGTVWSGRYKNMDVAVKIANTLTQQEYNSIEDGLVREVSTFCRFKHPSLVKYYGVVANHDQLNFWLVTEFVTGHNLGKLIKDPEVKSLYSLRRRERLEMSACISAALQYLHQKNIVHGDLNASNVWICTSGENRQVKISDFGLLMYKEAARQEETLASKQAAHFEPPEILSGIQHWDARADIWCLGALLLEFNLESYMWDSHCIEQAKNNYKKNYMECVDSDEPIRFGVKLKWSSFEFLWDALSFRPDHRPQARQIVEGMSLLLLETSRCLQQRYLSDDMIYWFSTQAALYKMWPSVAMALGVKSVIPVVRDVITINSEKVVTVLESWIVKYGEEATVAKLIGAIQSLNLQSVVDDFYREFQIPKMKRTGVKTRPHSAF